MYKMELFVQNGIVLNPKNKKRNHQHFGNLSEIHLNFLQRNQSIVVASEFYGMI